MWKKAHWNSISNLLIPGAANERTKSNEKLSFCETFQSNFKFSRSPKIPLNLSAVWKTFQEIFHFFIHFKYQQSIYEDGTVDWCRSISSCCCDERESLMKWNVHFSLARCFLEATEYLLYSIFCVRGGSSSCRRLSHEIENACCLEWFHTSDASDVRKIFDMVEKFKWDIFLAFFWEFFHY